MQFTGFCTESEKQSYRTDMGWLTLMWFWLQSWLGAAAAQHRKRVYTTHHQPGKGSRFETPSTVSAKCVLLSYHRKVQTLLGWTIVSRGKSVS